MKLAAAADATVTESHHFCLTEEGEGPRLSFNYDNAKHDDSPDILLLGQYIHPSTGNKLVGGINLHYLTTSEFNELTKALPQIMGAGNLKMRYEKGKTLCPSAFDKAYRTYKADLISGVDASTLYPKRGYLSAAKDYFKRTIGSLLKPADQRKKASDPQYPEDLHGLSKELDAVIARNRYDDAQAMQQAYDQEKDSKEVAAATPLDATPHASMRDIGATINARTQQTQHELEEPEIVDPLSTQPQEPEVIPAARPAAEIPLPKYTPTPAFTPKPAPVVPPAIKPVQQPEVVPPDVDYEDDVLESVVVYKYRGKLLYELYDPTPDRKPIALYRKLFAIRPFISDRLRSGVAVNEAILKTIASVSIKSTSGGSEDKPYIIAYDDNEAYAIEVPRNTYTEDWYNVENIRITDIDRPDWLNEKEQVINESSTGSRIWK